MSKTEFYSSFILQHRLVIQGHYNDTLSDFSTVLQKQSLLDFIMTYIKTITAQGISLSLFVGSLY